MSLRQSALFAKIDLPRARIGHHIGPGAFHEHLAEIQQRSDATFRLFDYDRKRGLHIDNAIAVSDAGPAQIQSAPRRLTSERTLLVASPYFVLERIELSANSSWALNAEPETWFLLLDGHAAIELAVASVGETIFIGGDCAGIEVGTSGLVGLIAYPGPDPIPSLLQNLDEHSFAAGLRLPLSTEREVRS